MTSGIAFLIKVDVWEMLTDGFFTPVVLKTFDIHTAIACSSPSQISQCPTDRSITVVTYTLTHYKVKLVTDLKKSTKTDSHPLKKKKKVLDRPVCYSEHGKNEDGKYW